MKPSTAAPTETGLPDIHEGLISGVRKEYLVDSAQLGANDGGNPAQSATSTSVSQLVRNSAVLALWSASKPPLASHFAWLLERVIVWLQVRCSRGLCMLDLLLISDVRQTQHAGLVVSAGKHGNYSLEALSAEPIV